MGQICHGSATTAHAVTAAIQRSQASLAQLSRELGINPKTVAKWRKRTTVDDMKTGPTEPRSTVLTEAEEAMVVAFRHHKLPLDPIVEELGRDLYPFDLICHVAFAAKPLTRRERAENVKKRDAFTKYGDKARAVLDALLAKYADKGVLNLDDANVLRIAPFSSIGKPIELIRALGGKPGFEQAVHDLQSAIYEDAA